MHITLEYLLVSASKFIAGKLPATFKLHIKRYGNPFA